jgi:tRNA(Ile2) C34 agmatinyltransferase TiaS
MTCDSCNTQPIGNGRFQCADCGNIVRVDSRVQDGMVSSASSPIDTGRPQTF